MRTIGTPNTNFTWKETRQENREKNWDHRLNLPPPSSCSRSPIPVRALHGALVLIRRNETARRRPMRPPHQFLSGRRRAGVGMTETRPVNQRVVSAARVSGAKILLLLHVSGGVGSTTQSRSRNGVCVCVCVCVCACACVCTCACVCMYVSRRACCSNCVDGVLAFFKKGTVRSHDLFETCGRVKSCVFEQVSTHSTTMKAHTSTRDCVLKLHAVVFTEEPPVPFSTQEFFCLHLLDLGARVTLGNAAPLCAEIQHRI